MNLLWLFFEKSLMLKETDRCMREGLSHMVELKSSNWTPTHRAELQYMLEKIIVAHNNLDVHTDWWPKWISVRFINPFKLMCMAKAFELEAETMLVAIAAHDATYRRRPAVPPEARLRPPVMDVRRPHRSHEGHAEIARYPGPSSALVGFTFDPLPPTPLPNVSTNMNTVANVGTDTNTRTTAIGPQPARNRTRYLSGLLLPPDAAESFRQDSLRIARGEAPLTPAFDFHNAVTDSGLGTDR